MTDIQAHLDKIRSDAAECILLSSLAPGGKREIFSRTAEHLNGLVSEIERTIAANTADDGKRGGRVHLDRPVDHEEAAEKAGAHQQPAAQPRRMFPWLLVIVLAGIVGTFFWPNTPANEHLFSALRPKHEASQEQQHNTIPAVSAILFAEQADRKILMEQLSALTARLDGLATALENLKTARAEVVTPSNNETVGAAERRPGEAKQPPDVEQTVTSEENRTSARESPPAAKQSHGVPAAADGPQIESVDRVGAISVPSRDSRKLGPQGCMQFRSFDPISGTYTTLDGRRRECRQ